jgi:hypothetical protein
MITTKEIDHKEKNIHCPLCNHLSVKMPEKQEPIIDPCEHLLFVAHDMGFEYRSERFNQYLVEQYGTDDFDDTEPFETDTVDIEGAIQLVQHQPALSFYGTYFGFAKK